MTYDSLVADIEKWLERDDTNFISQIPDFIELGQRRIANELKILGLKVPITSNFQANNPIVVKPDRWRETVSWNYGVGENENTRVWVYPRTYEYCRTYWPTDTDTAPPKFYTDYDYNHWLVCPTPDSDYPIEIIIWQLPKTLSVVNQTNWLTDFAPDLIFYASLLETAPYLKADDRLQMWKERYDATKNAFLAQDLRRITDQTQIVFET